MIGRVAASASAAGRWWIDELAGLVPARLRRGPEAGSRIVVDLARQGVRLLHEAGRTVRVLAPADKTPMPLAVAVDILRGRADRKPVVVRLQHADCFKRTIDLPAAARADYRQILSLQLARVAPFEPGSVAEAHLVGGRGGAAGTLEVLHLAARRARFEPAVSALSAEGVKVAAVDCWDAAGEAPLPVDFLAAERPRHAVARRWQWAGAATALAAAALVGDIWRQDAALAGLATETAALRPRVLALQRAEEARHTAGRAVERALALRSQRPTVTAIIEELTRVLPDAAVLQQVRIDREIIDISGTAGSAVSLLPAIEGSRLFHDARLTGPVSSDRDGRERFGIRMQLRRPASAAADAGPGGRS